MSAFCIHAVSRNQILTAAKKKVEPSITFQRNFVRMMTEGEWERCVAMTAAVLYRNAKPTCVSPKFDAPNFAQTWADLALRSGDIGDYALMAYTPTGQIDAKTKMPVCQWRRYVPMAEAA